MSGPEAHEDLSTIAATIQERFDRDRSLLSFADYYALFLADPSQQARGAAAYVLDSVEAGGAREVAGGKRYEIFDAAFDKGRDPLVAQEGAQGHLIRILRNFVREGRVSVSREGLPSQEHGDELAFCHEDRGQLEGPIGVDVGLPASVIDQGRVAAVTEVLQVPRDRP